MRRVRFDPEQLHHGDVAPRKMRTPRPKRIDQPLPPFPAKSEAELRELAFAIVSGHIVGTWWPAFVRDPQLALVVFMPLAAMEPRQRSQLAERQVVHVYADLRLDGYSGRAVNGLPCFFSCRYLSKSDADRLNVLVPEIVASVRELVQPTSRSGGS